MKKISDENFSLYQRLSRFILDFRPYCVVDVGASDGWFSKIILHFKPDAHILAFEPLRTHSEALALLQKKHSNFEYQLKAVGKKAGIAEIAEYGTKGLSSLKKMLPERYAGKGFQIDLIKRESTEITTLDDFFKNRADAEPLVIKIDTQGFEMEVLQSASRLFSENRIDCIVIELATIPKYAGQALSSEILRFFDEQDFILFDLHPFFYEKSGPLTEFDAVFINRRSKLYKHLYEKVPA